MPNTSSSPYWDHVIGQANVVELLKRSLESGHIAHAYLFHGIEGAGKRAVALAFARALQCEGCSDDPPCPSCKRAIRLQHPDIEILIPEPSDAKPHEVSDRIALLAEEPYAAVDFVRAPTLGSQKTESKRFKQALYSVDRINLQLREKIMMRPSQGKYRIAIITDVDVIRERAANAFLKVLEEPNSGTIFILTTCRKNALLPTITSRCQHVAFESLSPDTIVRALLDRTDVDEDLANVAANMSQGSYMRALELIRNEELRRDRERVISFLRLAFLGKIVQQTDLIAEVNQSSRDGIRNLLRLLLSWIRDVALYREIGEEAAITNHDQIVEISKFSKNLQNADLDAMSRLIEEALLLTESNVNTNLLLINLSMRLGEAMRTADYISTPIPITIFDSLGKARRTTHSGKLFKPLASFKTS